MPNGWLVTLQRVSLPPLQVPPKASCRPQVLFLELKSCLSFLLNSSLQYAVYPWWGPLLPPLGHLHTSSSVSRALRHQMACLRKVDIRHRTDSAFGHFASEIALVFCSCCNEQSYTRQLKITDTQNPGSGGRKSKTKALGGFVPSEGDLLPAFPGSWFSGSSLT
jgi:hypothetical protein